ncbi:MAG: glycosyltransferase family 2 protein [Clostridia bacterium]|nr:glycosyltransferase family 2 protein [Clostridia bacterium]
MHKKVSVVLPVYNGAEYLAQSIESILAQTYENWELIIVDDGSTDATAAIAAAYAEKDDRIFYYKNPQNMKLPRSLNRGFALSTGEYLTWTSDDNIYYADAFATMVAAFEKDPQLGFVFSSCDVIDSDGKKIGEWFMPRNMELRKIMGANIVGACFMYTRRVYAIIGDYNPDLFLAEDFDYWQRIFATFKVQPIEAYLYAYRDHPDNLTHTENQQLIAEICERTIIKNALLYDKLDRVQEFFMFEGLNYYREKNAVAPDYYKPYLDFYNKIHLLFYRAPRKLQRLVTARLKKD